MAREEQSARRLSPARRDLAARLSWIAAALFLTFLLGFATSHLRLPASGFLAEALDQGRALATGRHAGMSHLRPARYTHAGVACYDPTGARVPCPPGRGAQLTLLTGFWPDRALQSGLRLIDGDGRALHHWNVDAAAIWPPATHQDALAATLSAASSYVHGSYLFENGDVLFNVEFIGLARMNAAGEVLWRLDRRTHHSIDRADDGSFWVCESVWRSKVEDVFPKFLGVAPPVMEDRVLRVAPDGQILQEISIMEVLFRTALKDQIWRRARTGTDLIHLNDVEALTAAIADQYPLFAAGDLLVSLRDLDLVLVFDPASGAVKWWADRPFHRQHDPDFIGGGWISVYDNRPDGSPAGQFLGGSRLLKLCPHTGEVQTIYGEGRRDATERPFYSDLGGKAQLLPNGHWVLSEPMAGRVFEIDATGRTVWEWVQSRHADAELISEVMEGTRYSFSVEQVASWDQGPWR